MEGNLIFFVNGRQPLFFLKGRQSHYQMEDQSQAIGMNVRISEQAD